MSPTDVIVLEKSMLEACYSLWKYKFCQS